MKTTPVSLCLILLFTISSLCAARRPNRPVLDAEGDALRVGAEYYASFYLWPTGGGLGLASPPNQTCPQSVVQFVEFPGGPRIYGLPLTFHPLVQPEDGVIRQGVDLNIRFEEANPPCPESTVWKVDNPDSNGKRYITAGGQVGNSLNSLFRVEQASLLVSRFVHCPAVGLKCTGVERYSSDGYGGFRLALDSDKDVPFFGVVFFKKESESVIRLPK